MRHGDLALHGRPLTCKDCGGGFNTLVKTGDGEYRHQSPKSCKAQRAHDAKRKPIPARKPRIVLP